VPLHDLADLLGFATSDRPPEAAVLVGDGEKFVALAVQQLPERREVFLKELHPILAGMPVVAGATLLSDGNAVLILDLEDLLELCRTRSAS
jgi:chemotaxis protein histidine kinase CheA